MVSGRAPGEPDYFLLGATASLQTLATRNLTTVLAGILIFSFVLGLTPTRALRWAFTNLPTPGNTNWPFFFVSLTASSESSARISPATRRGSSNFSAKCAINCDFVMGDTLALALALSAILLSLNFHEVVHSLMDANC